MREICNDCRGAGAYDDPPWGIANCSTCHGAGFIRSKKTEIRAQLGPRDDAKQSVADALYDSAYCAGLKHGFSLGQEDDRAGLQKALASRDGYVGLLREAVKLLDATQPPATPEARNE